jgi:cellulose synthase/poly-beta-1,6-N-acetylglucosamine synthase-like glycosyltransferase
MLLWKIIFWLSIFIIFYNYAGYAIVAYCFIIIKKKRRQIPKSFFPSVSFIVAAFNEQDIIKEKIINSLEQDYPSKKIEYIFITDGSNDETPAIISNFPQIKLLHAQKRKGKSAALNRAVSHATNDILIFSDSNAFLNKKAVLNIARHYSDEKTGGVAGEKKVIELAFASDKNINNEGLYWKYESILKKIDSDFYSVVGAAGELFSIRKHLYEPLPESIILDDFVLSLKVAEKGHRIAYEPDAYAFETPSFSIAEEKKRKIRIAAGGFQAILFLKSIFQFWKHPKLFFLYFSHRVLRWTLSPVCFIFAFIANLILAVYYQLAMFQFFMIGQMLFYTLGLIGFISPKFSNKLKPAKLCYYLIFMNLSVILGFIRFLRGKQPSVWEKAKRA